MQGSGGIRGPQVVVQGGTMTIDVATGDKQVCVSQPGSGRIEQHSVAANGSVTFPVPNVPAGTILMISVGRGLRARVLLVEVLGSD